MEPVNTSPEAEISIFDDARKEQEEKHKKVIKNARTSLFVIAAFQLVVSLFLAFTQEEGLARTADIIFGVMVSSIFAGMGFLSKRKPFIALVIGLCVYIAVQLLGMYIDPASIAKGIFVRILIISWLVKGIANAKQLEAINRDYAE